MTVKCACGREASFNVGNVYREAFDAGWRLSPDNKPQCPACSGTPDTDQEKIKRLVEEAFKRAREKRGGFDPFDPMGGL